MKLISMTDFVLEMVKQTEIKTYEWYFLKVFDYAQFIKHTLTLDMFIGDKALFEGFYLNDGYVCFKDGFIDVVEDIELYTIEDLLEYELTLTSYAIKLLRL
ncbi:MAG: hypothetical protein KBT36_14015 [Kurthia sp.]|nr:hypothetical protein [Candidatus Kurthia equi]